MFWRFGSGLIGVDECGLGSGGGDEVLVVLGFDKVEGGGGGKLGLGEDFDAFGVCVLRGESFTKLLPEPEGDDHEAQGGS